MTRRRMLLLGVLAIAVVLAVGVWRLWPQTAITLENYERINDGMTRAEVETILLTMADRTTSMEFRWIDWNRDHISEHGVHWEEAEAVVRQMQPPFPEQIGNDKLLAVGKGRGGRLLQVIYVLDADDTIFVIHARPLTDREKKRYRRRRKE